MFLSPSLTDIVYFFAFIFGAGLLLKKVGEMECCHYLRVTILTVILSSCVTVFLLGFTFGRPKDVDQCCDEYFCLTE